uniref:4-hydroxy-3-methylbut-2-enyl diphosphate reductase n=1 Tax=Compsopogon caeruleus TaxID=31354 RepID=A0A7S1TB44_9RHOD
MVGFVGSGGIIGGYREQGVECGGKVRSRCGVRVMREVRMGEVLPRDKKAARREVMAGENFNRKGFAETKEDAQLMMNQEFTSGLIEELRNAAYTIEREGITVKLAKAYGFCWGVERAVSMAYETRKQFPTENIWITNEIIHNPSVNSRLSEMGVHFVPQDGMKKDLSGVREGDVVILPAFGATLEEMEFLSSKKAKIVDTTCPWVSKVWNTLDRHKKAKCTSVIHGKWKHEETIATASFAETYLVVLNMNEAEYVCNYILHGGDKEEFLSRFKNAMSEGFDPDRDLTAVGIANQTTMLKNETTAIGKKFEKAMMEKYGTQNLKHHFVAFDTICDATQERQDAMYELVKEDLDFMIVVGGFNSSNTSHLQEIAEHAGIQSYWVSQPDCVGPGNSIVYRKSDGTELLQEGFIKEGPLTIGITSGASTPDRVVEDVLERVFMIRKLSQPVAV